VLDKLEFVVANRSTDLEHRILRQLVLLAD
jgi:hypothetical protein